MNYDEKNKKIITERLVLRLFQKSDAEAVTKLCNNYNIFKNTLYLPYPYDINDALTWMEHHLENFLANKSYEFAITGKESGQLYGAIALSNNQAFHHGEIAYWVGEEFWGNGYATEAANAIVQFAFDEKKYHKIFARFFGSNPASGRVLQKIGMKEEGVLLDHVRKEDRYEDLVYYGMIRENEIDS
ncbi:Protein N-acetyltransferase, RimJ/RimL family [Oceanobacillus limi]|uniref:Protein N-acetyltransferase, RimJ/RimL family n=1 Tax=Oceanobacillus limi TaxID=930131 RepID=A0A1H9YC40_9BACI|nr:GNAT family N-acetyltransferase [Oceanobacillus limi]SES66466.1 Protein N-acetyltransferase, RimJ/RimL family [Oceanobacillus limi]